MSGWQRSAPRDEIKDLEAANLQLESEIQSLKLTLEQERAERRHYHSLANEIITRLDVVACTIDDVVKRAEQEVSRLMAMRHKQSPKTKRKAGVRCGGI